MAGVFFWLIIMSTGSALFTPKNAEIFSCEKCLFKCSKKSDWNRHISTPKHKNQPFVNFSNQFVNQKRQGIENQENGEKKYDCICGKKYKDKSGLWRHKKKCFLADCKNGFLDTEKNKTHSLSSGVFFTPKNTDNSVTASSVTLKDTILKTEAKIQDECLAPVDKEFIYHFMKQNQEFQKELYLDLHKNMLEFMKTTQEQSQKFATLNNTTMNSHNNTNSYNRFNMNVFLNETCKDAMNIMDFVKSINVEIADLENVGKIGYIDGISNIIVKSLKALDISKRPMHCSDVKRETMYVKDEDKWEKEDTDNKRLKKAIKYVANKNFQLIPEWKKKYPDCVYSDSNTSDQYNRLLLESVGGKYDKDVNDTRIIKKIAKEVIIEK